MPRKTENEFDIVRIADDAVRVTSYHGGPEAVLPDEIDGMKVREIGREAFAGQTGLKSLILPEGLMSIHTGAFAGCVGLRSVRLPASVTDIAEGAFVRCVNLAEIDADPENEVYRTLDGVLFDRRGKTLLCYPAGRPEPLYELPISVSVMESGRIPSTLFSKKSWPRIPKAIFRSSRDSCRGWGSG